jgi:parallel beta-helix repeat protein
MDASPTSLSTPNPETNLKYRSGSADGSVQSIKVWPSSWGLTVGPASAQVAAQQKLKFTALAWTAGGDSIPVLVDWSASGGTITSDGVFSSSSAGTFSVVARGKGRNNRRSDTSTVVVVPSGSVTLIRLTVSPTSVTLSPGAQQSFAAQAVSSDGSAMPLAVDWTATGGTVDAAGKYTAGGNPGTYSIVATDPGSKLSDTAAITISATAPTLRSVVLTPTSASLSTGGTKAFTAVGLMSDNSTLSIPIRYSATGGTITSGGNYTAGGTAGTYRVVATDTSGSLADTASVTISAPTPTVTAVVLTPSTVSLQAGGTQQFAASGKMSDGSSTTVSVVYAATGGSISSSGNYTAGQVAGNYRVVATQSGGSLADTALTTVTAAPPPPGQTACSGVSVPAGSNIQNAVNANGAGTVFCLGAGTFAQQSVQPKAGQQFIGARDGNGNRLSILDGQNAITYAFSGSVSSVRIEGLIIQGYYGGSGTSTAGLASALFGTGAWTVIDNEVRNNTGAGVQIGTGSTIRRNYIHHNGWLGAVCGGSTGSNAVVDSNEVSYNNTRGIDPNWGAGGIKCVLTSNLTFRGNFVHHNAGHGLWCDNCNATTYYLGNRIEDNTFNGIYHEVSADAVIDGNQLARNGTSNRGGIWVDNSSNVEVRNNVVSGSANGLILIRQVSRPELPNRVLQNVYVHDNAVRLAGGEFVGGVQYVGDNAYFSTRNNRFSGNDYTLAGAGSTPFRWNDANMTDTQWRAAGQDVSGTFTR